MLTREKVRIAKRFDKLLDLYEDGKRWRKGNMATTRFGIPVSPKSKEADKFCLLGGISCIAKNERIEKQLTEILRESVGGNIVSFNDKWNTNWVDVKSVIEKAKDGVLNGKA